MQDFWNMSIPEVHDCIRSYGRRAKIKILQQFIQAESIAEQSVDVWASTKGVGNDFDEVKPEECRWVNMDKVFNANVSDIFKNQYLHVS